MEGVSYLNLTMYLLSALYKHRHFVSFLLRSNSQRKHILRWLTYMRPGYQLDHPLPWLAFDAIDFILPRLRPGMRIFEYGSGGSTLFWLSKGAACVSVEHNPDWYSAVKGRLPGAANVDYRLVLPEPMGENLSNIDPANPEEYFSADDNYKGYSFKNYVTQIDSFPDQHFDMIVIDGRARPACIRHSVSKVKPGGMIVVDNSERNYYFLKAATYLSKFEKLEFSGALPGIEVFVSTAIFFRKP